MPLYRVLIISMAVSLLASGCSSPQTSDEESPAQRSALTAEPDAGAKTEESAVEADSGDVEEGGASKKTERMRACDEQDWDACEALAVEFTSVEGRKDLARAREYLEKICESAPYDRCEAALNKVMQSGAPIESGTVTIPVLEGRCLAGESEACVSYAMVFSSFETQISYQEAYDRFASGCERADDDYCRAMSNLTRPAFRPLSGSLDADLVAFLANLEAACKRGAEDLCERLGEIHRQGFSLGGDKVEVDEEKAVDYFEKAGRASPSDAVDESDSPDVTDKHATEARVTVYSKPKGEIVVDGEPTGVQTPATVEVEQGERDVSVKFETGSESEPKKVRAMEGSRLKLFFREQ